MSKPIIIVLALALLAAAAFLIINGINANNSFSSDVSRAFTGSGTNKATGLLAGGIACGILGLGALAWGARGKS